MGKQLTLQKELSFSGIGLHTGQHVDIKLIPAEANHGIKFKRVDLSSDVLIRADVSRVSAMDRGTTLAEKEISIATVEHLLSALYASGVDNLLIEVNGEEIPILDGSSKQFFDEILMTGLKEQGEERQYFQITEPIHFKNEHVEISAYPSDTFDLTVMIDFDSPVIGKQYAEFNESVNYGSDISPCRTFVFLEDLGKLHDFGLIKGGTLENAIVISNGKVQPEEIQKLNSKLGVTLDEAKGAGILNENGLKFENELARHKVLDLIGDLSLVGRKIKARIIAKKPGHKGNVLFAEELKKVLNAQRKLKDKPNYNPNDPPVLDLEGIKNLIPHRHPFLFVDKIIEQTENKVVGIKNVSFDQSYFAGHFPGNPIFPGVIQIEALAQTGGVLALSTVPDPENWDTYFIKIEKTRFKHKVVPGDTLILKMELLSPIRRGICHMFGTAYVGDKIVSEGELTAQIIKRNT